MAGRSPGSWVVDQTAYRATAETAFRLLWQRLTRELREAWLLAAQLPPAWFSTELAEAIGLDAERRRGLVRLHILERDKDGRYQMHRLLQEFALSEEPPSRSVQQAVIRGATALLEAGDEATTLLRYRRDADSFAHLAAEPDIPDGACFRMWCAQALRQLGDLLAARALSNKHLRRT